MFIILCILYYYTLRRHTYMGIPTSSSSYITLLFYSIIGIPTCISCVWVIYCVCVCVGFAFARLRARVCVREKCQEQWRRISYRRRRARAAGGAWKTRSAECARVEFRRRKSRSHTARRKWLIAAASYLSRRRVFHGILSIRPRSVADILENNNLLHTTEYAWYYRTIRRNVNRIVYNGRRPYGFSLSSAVRVQLLELKALFCKRTRRHVWERGG